MMRFIRADMWVRGSYEEPSMLQSRTLALLDKTPGASLSELVDHLGVTRAKQITQVKTGLSLLKNVFELSTEMT